MSRATSSERLSRLGRLKAEMDNRDREDMLSYSVGKAKEGGLRLTNGHGREQEGYHGNVDNMHSNTGPGHHGNQDGHSNRERRTRSRDNNLTNQSSEHKSMERLDRVGRSQDRYQPSSARYSSLAERTGPSGSVGAMFERSGSGMSSGYGSQESIERRTPLNSSGSSTGSHNEVSICRSLVFRS